MCMCFCGVCARARACVCSSVYWGCFRNENYIQGMILCVCFLCFFFFAFSLLFF